jgi:hypothetical protein
VNLLPEDLGPHEQLLWVGRPVQGFMLRAIDLVYIPTILIWNGLVVSSLIDAIVTDAPVEHVRLIVGFALFGLYLLVGRFWVDVYSRAHTLYAVTSGRVMIVSGAFGRHTKSVSIDKLPEISLSERADGSGSIVFGPDPYWWYAGAGAIFHLTSNLLPNFELAAESRRVYEIIREAQRAVTLRL